jgi:SAM-dependent methyltransferase
VAPLRRRAVERLKLRNGDHVLDMGCGTGASFGALRSIVGATGQVTGIELSEEMAAVARQRIEDNEWKNVELLVGDAATAPLPRDVDGIVFFETHDLMRTPAVEARGWGGPRWRWRGRLRTRICSALGDPGQRNRQISGAPLRDHLRGVRRPVEPSCR